MLFWHKHNIEKSLADLPNFTPFPDEWTVEDKVLFEQAFSFHGKTFHRIQQMVSKFLWQFLFCFVCLSCFSYLRVYVSYGYHQLQTSRLLFVCFIYVGVLLVCMSTYHLCVCCSPRPEEGIRFLEWELETFVNWYLGAENWTQAFWKSSQFLTTDLPLQQLISPFE